MNPKLFRSIKLMCKTSLVFKIVFESAILQVKNIILNQIVENVSFGRCVGIPTRKVLVWHMIWSWKLLQ
jgi:hypothetical protein